MSEYVSVFAGYRARRVATYDVRRYSGGTGPTIGRTVVYNGLTGFTGLARSATDAFNRYAVPTRSGLRFPPDELPAVPPDTVYGSGTSAARPVPVRSPDPITIAPRETEIVVFDPATVRARRAKRARGVPTRYFRVRNKRRNGPTTNPPAGFPRYASDRCPERISQVRAARRVTPRRSDGRRSHQPPARRGGLRGTYHREPIP